LLVFDLGDAEFDPLALAEAGDRRFDPRAILDPPHGLGHIEFDARLRVAIVCEPDRHSVGAVLNDYRISGTTLDIEVGTGRAGLAGTGRQEHRETNQ